MVADIVLEECHMIPGLDPSIESYPNYDTRCAAEKTKCKHRCQIDGADVVVVQLSQGLKSLMEPHLVGLLQIMILHILPFLLILSLLRRLMPIVVTVSGRECPNRC